MNEREEQLVAEGNALKKRELDLSEQRLDNQHELRMTIAVGLLIIISGSACLYGLAQLELDWARGIFCVSLPSAFLFFFMGGLNSDLSGSKHRELSLLGWFLMLVAIGVCAITWPLF